MRKYQERIFSSPILTKNRKLLELLLWAAASSEAAAFFGNRDTPEFSFVLLRISGLNRRMPAYGHRLAGIGSLRKFGRNSVTVYWTKPGSLRRRLWRH